MSAVRNYQIENLQYGLPQKFKKIKLQRTKKDHQYPSQSIKKSQTFIFDISTLHKYAVSINHKFQHFKAIHTRFVYLPLWVFPYNEFWL